MPLETFTRETFKDDLFEYLGEQFDAAEDAGVELEDHVFLSLLSRASVNEEKPLYVSQLMQMLHDYVHTREENGEEIGPVVRHLYDIIRFDFKHNLEFLIDSLDDDPVEKDAFILLMMRHFEKEFAYNGYLVTDDSPKAHEYTASIDDSVRLIPSVSALYYRLNKIIEKDPPENQRIQIIVRQKQHYIPIDIDKKTRQCLIIDAAADSTEIILRDFINYTPHLDRMAYVAQHDYIIPESIAKPDMSNVGTSRVQKDNWSCSIFSLEYSRIAALKSDIHEEFIKTARQESDESELYSLPWKELGPEFISMSQSPTYKMYYAQEKKDPSLSVDTMFSESNFAQVKLKFKSIAIAEIKEHTEEELIELTSPKKILKVAKRSFEDYSFGFFASSEAKAPSKLTETEILQLAYEASLLEFQGDYAEALESYQQVLDSKNTEENAKNVERCTILADLQLHP